MKKITLSLFGLGLFVAGSLFGQVKQLNPNNMRDGEKVEYCQSHTIEQELLKDAQYKNFREAYEAQIQQIIQEQKQNPTKRGTVYTIPIVFHVLHNGGPENISREQVLDGMRILAEDYRLLNNDAKNVHPDFNLNNASATCFPFDAEIQFVLATKAPDGTVFGGITRTFSAETNTGTGNTQMAAVQKGNDVFKGEWPGNKYLNVLVANNIGGAAGYARYPFGTNTTMATNTIFLLHNYLGSFGTSNPNQSRALTHEIGHWLNLSHTWGNNNDPMVACGSDFVDDTPETRGVRSCNLNENFCGSRANVENFMDYSYCSKMFSKGQVERMRAALTSAAGGRSNVWTDANLASVGGNVPNNAVKADFVVSSNVTCIGSTLNFKDQSFNKVTSWNWQFEGGTPATSTVQNPSVTYNTPGIYKVVLTISDGVNTKSTTKTNFVRVLPKSLTIPFLEGFETTTSIANNPAWYVENPGGNAGWEVTNTAAKTGKNSILLKNFNQAAGNIDELVSAPWDLRNVNSTDKVTLSFRYAYRKKTSVNDDYLKVFFTSNCGDLWEQRKTMHGTTLSNLTNTAEYVPLADDWITVHMTNVVSSFWVENFRFKFRFEGDGGNNIYLDDINLYYGAPSDNLVASVNEASTSFAGAKVYPNPTEGDINVVFNAENYQTVNVSVVDMLGNVVSSYAVNANSGLNSVEISTADLSSGMYFVRLANGTTSTNLQFVVK